MTIPAPPWWFIPLLIAAIAAVKFDPAKGATSDEWFKLVVELQKQERCLYGPDRNFLRDMINALTADDNVMPTTWQIRWLLALKKECKL